MRSVYKPLALYFIVLAAICLAYWQPSFSWLFFVSLLTLVPGVIWLWRAEGRSVRDLGLHRVESWRCNVGWGFLVGLILPIVLITVEALSGWITLAPGSLPMTNVTTVVLLTGIHMAFTAAWEELVFRGYFLQCFSLAKGTRLAVLSSSLLWALFHLPAMVDSGLPSMFAAIGMATFIVWGVALGIGFLHTDNTLWFPFGLHYGYNLSFSLLGDLLLIGHSAPRWLVGHAAWAPGSGLLGLLLWAVTLVGVWWGIGRKGSASPTSSARPSSEAQTSSSTDNAARETA